MASATPGLPTQTTSLMPPPPSAPGPVSPPGTRRYNTDRTTLVLAGMVGVLALVVVAMVAVMIGKVTQPDDESGADAQATSSVSEGGGDADGSLDVGTPSTTTTSAAPTTSPAPPTTVAATALTPAYFSARVSRTCGHSGRGDCFLSVRSGPTSSSTEMYRLNEGTTVSVQCQVEGESVTSSSLGSPTTVWARGTDGNYMSAAFLEGPGLDPFAVTTPC
jgi:hypothetical protein